MKNIALCFLIVVTAFSSCRFMEGRRIKGDGNITTQQRTATGFAGVETRGSIDLEVSQGDYKITVEADQNIIPYIVTEVENGNLVVYFKEDFNSYSPTRVKVAITAPSLHVFEASGSGNITGRGAIVDSNKMEIGVGGSGNIDLDINSPVVTVQLAGSGNIALKGATRDLTTETNGSGNIEAYGLKAETTKSSIHGSGNSNVSASVKLTAEIYGSGNINYKGRPQVQTETHGSGTVREDN